MSRSRRTRTLNKEENKEVEEAFKVFDVDNSNSMNEKELIEALRALGFDVSKKEVAEIIRKKDTNNTGVITLQVFKEICADYFRTRDPRIEIMRAFALFDTNHDGLIDIEDLKKISVELGDPLPVEELEIMINKFDRDHDGCINMDEFMNIMDPTHSCH